MPLLARRKRAIGALGPAGSTIRWSSGMRTLPLASSVTWSCVAEPLTRLATTFAGGSTVNFLSRVFGLPSGNRSGSLSCRWLISDVSRTVLPTL